MGTQNRLGFIIEINNPERIFFGILLADIAWGLQKLGMILENNVSIKFKFLNNHF